MTLPTILFVGDSLTAGMAGSTDHTGFRGPFSLLSPGYEAVGPFVDPKGLHHGGIGGATVKTFGAVDDGSLPSPAARFVRSTPALRTWMQQYQPDVLHFMLGTNDLATGRAPNIIADDVGFLLKLAHEQSPKTRILLASVPDTGPRAKELNSIYRSSASNGQYGEGTKFIDTSKLLNEAYGKDGFAALTKDSHPNDRGYLLMAQSLVSGLKGSNSNSIASGSESSGTRVFIATAVGFGAYKVWKWLNP